MNSPAIQSVRVTEELFLTDSVLRHVLGLKTGDIILEVKRASAGYGKRQQLDLAGTLILVLRGGKE